MIDKYTFGSITIGVKTYHSDVLITPEGVDDAWWRREGHRLRVEDLKKVISAHPDTLVVGTGYFGEMRIDPAVTEALKKEGIALFASRTSRACDEFNRLRSAQKVVAALHLTC